MAREELLQAVLSSPHLRRDASFSAIGQSPIVTRADLFDRRRALQHLLSMPPHAQRALPFLDGGGLELALEAPWSTIS
jgi:hypothetical protein